MKYALVWGRSARHYPQHCGLSHRLEDEDVVQIVKKKVWRHKSFFYLISLISNVDDAGENFQEREEGGRGRFKTHSNAPARIADREKKAPLKQ